MADLVVLENLTKRFGDILAVDQVSMTVGSGEVLGFLGPNGAGKSTTMKMVAGFLEPSGGSATVGGLDVTTSPVEVKRRIGYLPEGAPTYGDMTARGFLNFIAEIRGFDGAERARRVDEVVAKVKIEKVLGQTIETLSKGYKRRVGLAQAILHDPEVLILDEPTDGLDPNQKHHVRSLIQEMASDKAIIISTHILEEVEAVCSRAVVIAGGRVVADGTPEQLMARDANHNAVTVSVAVEHADNAVMELSAVSGVATVATLDKVNGVARLRAVSADGGMIVDGVGNRLREHGIAVTEMYVERGALDDVFRDITTQAEAAPHA